MEDFKLDIIIGSGPSARRTVWICAAHADRERPLAPA